MKKITMLSGVLSVLLFVTISFAATETTEQWELEFISALDEGTPAIDEAIINAFDSGAIPKDILVIALAKKTDAYTVLKSIIGSASSGKYRDQQTYLNELCTVAMANGVDPSVFTQAAKDAESSPGVPALSAAEIKKIVCIEDVGLGFTPSGEDNNAAGGAVSPPSIGVSSGGAGLPFSKSGA